MESIVKKISSPLLSQGLAEITKPFAAPEKRRAVRVDVQNAFPGVQIGHFGGVDRMFKVKCVAEYGAAFFHGGVDLKSEIGRDVQSFIALNDLQIPVVSRMLYLTPLLAGVQFIAPSSGTKISIRSHFYLEYTAASMNPRVVTPPPAPTLPGLTPPPPPPLHQRVRWLKFGNDRNHQMEIIAQGSTIKSFRIDLAHAWATVEWQVGRNLLVKMAARQDVTVDQLRSQIVSFLRNLKGVNPLMLQEIGGVACTEDIDIIYPEVT